MCISGGELLICVVIVFAVFGHWSQVHSLAEPEVKISIFPFTFEI